MMDLASTANSLRTRLEAGVKVDSSRFLQVMSNQEKQTKELEDSIIKLEEQAAGQTSLKDLVNQVFHAYRQQLHETRRIEDHLRNYGYAEQYPDPAPENILDLIPVASGTTPEDIGSLQISCAQVLACHDPHGPDPGTSSMFAITVLCGLVFFPLLYLALVLELSQPLPAL